MTKLLRAWCDTLADLGIIGLIPTRNNIDSVISIEVVKKVHHINAPNNNTIIQADVIKTSNCLFDLETNMSGCLACSLGDNRIRMVFGEGSNESRLMFIGEGPGRDEDITGRPFVGKAGELFDKMCISVGLDRKKVYITNIVKCRPPDNRTPTKSEAQTCLPYLKRQIELVQPKIIVTLGATPLRELLCINTGITRVRGQWQHLNMLDGIPVMPTFHPAYVLRQYTRTIRQAVWDDLKAAKDWLDH